MEDTSFTITIQGDSEGYVTFECPFCGAEFKLQAGGFQEFSLFDMRENRMEYEANLFAAQLMLPDDEIKEYIYKGFDIHHIARAMRSDINLVAIKVAELNRQGFRFRAQEFRSNFLK